MARADAEARGLLEGQDLATLPVDPEKTAAGLGAIVVRQGAPVELSGMLMRRDGQNVIGLRAELDPARQRFALAHLVGHLHLHARRELLLDTAARYTHHNLPSMPTDREEAEANRFASALLMPEQVVRRMAIEAEARAADQLLELLTPRFEVTRTVMAARLMSLGIIGDV